MSAQPDSQTPSPLQEERNRAARAQIGRACGVALIEISAGLESGTVVQRGAGVMTMVRVAFAARGRRLLRAAYILLDNGHSPEAVPLLRTIFEYVIVGRWLVLDDEKHLRMWVHADVAKTLLIDDRAFEHGDFRLMQEEAREIFEAAKDELRGDAGKVDRVPTVEKMAELVGLSFAYNTAYRIDSQSAVHASGMAVNNAFEEVREGYVIRPEPLVTLGRLENYGRGAAALADLLSDADSVIPELGWTTHLDFVHRVLADLGQTGSSADTE